MARRADTQLVDCEGSHGDSQLNNQKDTHAYHSLRGNAHLLHRGPDDTQSSVQRTILNQSQTEKLYVYVIVHVNVDNNNQHQDQNTSSLDTGEP